MPPVAKGQGRRHARRDPRFDDMCGEYDPAMFQSAYAFIDELKTSEMEKLQKKLKKLKDPTKKAELQAKLGRYVSILSRSRPSTCVHV